MTSTFASSGPWPWAGRFLLAVLAGNMLIDALEVSVVVVALPSIGTSLGLSPWDAQWVTTGFAVGFGALLLPGRWLASRLGRRRMYLGAMALFVCASVAGGLTDDPRLLMATRVVKGACAALTAPTGLAIISTAYPQGTARSRALSVYSFFGAIGFTTGLLLSAALVPLSWRLTFAATAPVAAVLLVLAAGAVPRDPPGSSETSAKTRPRLTGALLRSAAGAAALNGSYLGLLLLAGYQLQLLGGFAPWQTALAFLPACVPLAVSALSGGRVVERFGPPRLIALGAAAPLLGLVLYVRAGTPTPYATALLPTLALFGAGFVLAFVALNAQAGNGVPVADRGRAIALYQAAVQFGAVVVPATVALLLTRGPLHDPARPGADAADYRPAVLLLVAVAAGGLLAALWGLAAARPRPHDRVHHSRDPRDPRKAVAP
ncbi:MFS transporter [Streptomyces europaeiscabiei]|uniref:MFS transporter n=1 Tax=Streptomyces europaeiscabiei TaxID=146819 RepID=UPI0029AAD32E|nr:MFS transporter [Streptomyces europaeiscabiei]MDX3691344.1 MFS transporter [Streptomyces europaeiscabiei]